MRLSDGVTIFVERYRPRSTEFPVSSRSSSEVAEYHSAYVIFRKHS